MRAITTLLLPIVLLSHTPQCQADNGDPVAIIRLPGGGVAIETMWNMSVVITDSTKDLTSRIPGVDVIPAGLATSHNPSRDRFLVDTSVAGTDYVLDRAANQMTVTWKPYAKEGKHTSNAIRVRELSRSFLIDVDGTRILYMADPAKASLTRPQLAVVQGCDAMIGGPSVQPITPKRLIISTIPDLKNAKVIDGNTVVISSTQQPSQFGVLVLQNTPIKLSAQLTSLINRKEAACEASQDVFAKLSIAQLNFRPSNGSHTPRWNAEHMMGRELLFFSQIYHAQDDSIRKVDLNPKQMPPDYKAKHPEWTGTEEAMQMERVSAFTRRFAYLLNDLPLDRKAPGSGWTPQALLRQMERHYNDHTANVKKKFALPDWPKK